MLGACKFVTAPVVRNSVGLVHFGASKCNNLKIKLYKISVRFRFSRRREWGRQPSGI